MKLSIIIPIYNAEKTLSRCLESIHKQSYTDYEVIMVNDGSKDKSEIICKEITQKDKRFRYFSQENAGPGAARNHGIDEAKGEFIIFVDADDWVEKGYLTTIMAPENDGYDAVIWGFTEEWKERSAVITPKAEAGNEYNTVLQTIYKLKQAVQYGMSWNCRFRLDTLHKHDIRMPLDVKLHEDCIFTNWYFQHIQSLRVLAHSGYHYVHPEGESLCTRRFYPSDETYSMALQMYKSVEPWINLDNLGNYEIYNYLSKLSLSVLDMYKCQDNPKKDFRQRMQRIAFVKAETSRFYSRLKGRRKKTHYLFRFMPVIVIGLIYRWTNRKS